MKQLTLYSGTLKIKQKYCLWSKLSGCQEVQLHSAVCVAMAEDLTQQMWKDIRVCERFSMQLDESMHT